MVISINQIDIRESKLNREGNLLDILLIDRTSGKNIIWATDSYKKYGSKFAPNARIEPLLITGKYEKLIQPRAVKSIEEQQKRTREKAEVFTPLNIIEKMNSSVNVSGKFRNVSKNNWHEFTRQVWLEITCGEGPFIVSRYDTTAHSGELVLIKNRVGFLDKKLKVVSKYCDNKKDWLFWTKEAYKSSYGYEWQGDSLLIARENLLYTFMDYYEAKFDKKPPIKILEEFAEIISWNIFQMNGLQCMTPMSCHHETKIVKGLPTLFEERLDFVEKHECEGCKYNGTYVKIMDWSKNKVIRFVDIIR